VLEHVRNNAQPRDAVGDGGETIRTHSVEAFRSGEGPLRHVRTLQQLFLLRSLTTKLPWSSRILPTARARMDGQQMAYEDPNTPRHSNKKPLLSLKKLILREKQPPKSTIPLTVKNLEQFHNPDYTDIHDAFVRVRPQRKVSVHEWLQLLP
jgi:hypothetical protein